MLNLNFKMKKTLLTCGVFAALLLLLTAPSGCYYDNEEDRFPGSNSCDTTSMRFSVEIKQIMEDNCNRCHLESEPNYSGVPFETYDQVKEVADNGKLVDRINDQNAPMPQEGLMALCDRQKIAAWVNAGAPNN